MVTQRNAELSRGQPAGSGSTTPASPRSESLSTFFFTSTSSHGDMSDDPNASSGSKSSTTGDSIDFRFLNFSHPQDAKNAQTRRNVRSHVTTEQHKKQRQRAAEHARRTQQGPSEQLASPILTSPQDRASSAGSPVLSETETSSPEASSPGNSSPTPVTRINPTELYPREWHEYLRPVMVRRRTYSCLIERYADHCLRTII